MLIKLTWPEQLFAAQAGVMRRISAIQKSRSEPYGTPESDLWGIDIESCGAEAAVAKLIGKYWSAFHNRLDSCDGDVSGFEVRSTSRIDGKLIVHSRDKDESPYILVRGKMPEYDVVGWMYGKDAKMEKYIFAAAGRKPAYYVPSGDLRGMDDLPV